MLAKSQDGVHAGYERPSLEGDLAVIQVRYMRTVADLLPPRTLLDGAVGTELMGRGLRPADTAPESWNVDHPDTVRQIHQRYFDAGSHAVQTNTFGGNRIRLATFGLQAKVREYNVEGARLACAARPTGGIVIGSVGPTGLTPPPEGDAKLTALEHAFAEQAAALAEGGVDMLHVETMYHPKEARAAVRGCREGAPDLPIAASFTARLEGGVYTTMLGYSIDLLVQAFVEEGATAVGVNCTLAPADMLDVVERIATRTRLPILAKPTIAPHNAPPLSPNEFATGVLALFATGAHAVGGCCGTGPADIAAAAGELDA